MDNNARKRLLEADEQLGQARQRIVELERALSVDLDRTAWNAAQDKIRELNDRLEARDEHISELYKMIGHAVHHLRLVRYDDAKALLEALLPEMPPAEPGEVGVGVSSPEELAKAEWELAQAELVEAAGSGDPLRYANAMQRAQNAKLALAAAPPVPAAPAQPADPHFIGNGPLGAVLKAPEPTTEPSTETTTEPAPTG